MNLGRWLAEERVDLDLDAAFDSEHPAQVETLATRMAALLATSPDIVNASKLRTDLVLRERRAPSLPGHGVAMPHVRSLQARRLVLAVGVSRAGLPLPTPDGEPVRLVIALVGHFAFGEALGPLALSVAIRTLELKPDTDAADKAQAPRTGSGAAGKRTPGGILVRRIAFEYPDDLRAWWHPSRPEWSQIVNAASLNGSEELRVVGQSRLRCCRLDC